MKKTFESKFVKIVCTRCKNEQIIFGKSTSKIKCEKCNKLLTKTTGGKTQMKTLVKEVLL